MSERLLSEVSGHPDYSGYGSYAGYDVLDDGWSGVPQAPQESYAPAGGDAQQWYGQGGYAQDAYAQGGYAQDSYAQESYAREAAYAQDGYAPDGYPQDGYAQSGYSQGGYAQDAAHPQDGFAQQHGYAQDGGWDSGAYATADVSGTPHAVPGHEQYDGGDADFGAETPEVAGAAEEPEAAPDPEPEPERVPVATAARGQRGGRRRCARTARSAFLSVAAPSLAVLGVTAVATAATVSESGTGPGEPAPVAAPDPDQVEQLAVNEEFDTRLSGLTAAVDDYAERASRTQGRIDLEAQQEAEAEAAAEAARIAEEMRPKFFLPVEQHGLSAYFGQSGVNWMSTHTGIDFPVAYGTSVRAATDGSISTQYHPSYGNMMILTAPDGTETWYCHLSSSVYTSGSVQAGTVIAYSGNSGTSTGPHLHFEVRPGGGSPIDPLSWLRNQGLEPT